MGNKNTHNSKVLDYILFLAVGNSGPEGSVLTAEKVLLSALKLCCFPKDTDGDQDKDDPDQKELRDTEGVLRSYFDDPEQTVESLESLTASGTANANSELSLNTILYKAGKEAAKQGKEILSADAAIQYILLHPTDSLKKWIDRREAAVQSPEGTESAEDADHIRKLAELDKKAKKLRRQLSKRIFGQDHAIQTLVNGYFKAESLSLIEKERHCPKAVYLFAGPPGVGKTFLAESAAEFLGLPFRRFDMTTYAVPTDPSEFTSSRKSSSVTAFLRKNAQCILLFDEIEKASPFIIHQFLQILDDGSIMDPAKGEEVSFSEAILIFTTNAGRPLYLDSETDNFSDVPEKTILKALELDTYTNSNTPYFPPELCSRFATANVVMFNYMEAPFLVRIAREEILSLADGYAKTFDTSIEIEESVYSALLFSEGGSADARTIRSRAENFLQEEIRELVRLAPDAKSLKTVRIAAKLPNEGEVLDLFLSDKQQEMLVFASRATVTHIRKTCPEGSAPYKAIGEQKCQEAKKRLSKGDIRLILLDPTCGQRETQTDFLNIEDIDSEARDLLTFVREQYHEIPVYILKPKRHFISEEEMVSLLHIGVCGIIDPSSEDFSSNLEEFSKELHQQDSMRTLAKFNRLVTFETGQELSKDGSHGDITLFDFNLRTAVDPDEKGNIMGDFSIPDARFDQIIGAKYAKEALQDYIIDLKTPRKNSRLIGRLQGVLLYGPPGTGKTMLARAMAGEAHITFINMEGNRFLDKYVGEGPARVHEYFQKARKYAPSILFVDEIDAIAINRNSEGARYTKDILTAFLAEMDGFVRDPSRPVFVLAATNIDIDSRGENSLDPAFLRRFNQRIFVGLPNCAERKEYLDVKTADTDLFKISEAMKENIATRSMFMSLDALEHVLNLAMHLARRKGMDKVTDKEMDEAFEQQTFGEERGISEQEVLLRTARHEAGHAYIHWKNGGTPSYVTIASRKGHLGYMQPENNETSWNYTKNELLADIRNLLAGRAAEIVYYGPEDGIDSGASSDLRRATGQAKQFLCTFGMDPEFGMAVIDDGGTGSPGAQQVEMDPTVRAAINKILEEQLQLAIETIRKGQEKINQIVDELLANQSITGDKLEDILNEC